MGGTILAVGGGSKFAGLVIPALAKRGANVRALFRDQSAAIAVRANGAIEVAIGDLRDRSSISRALEGVTSIFYIAPAFLPHEVQVGQALVAAAIDAGVQRFVFSSVIHPVLGALPNHAEKAAVEEAVLDSDLEYSFLHPTLFFQNYAGSWARTAATGVLAEPWSTHTRFSRVDYRDVADVAAIALTEDRLLHGTFELCSEGVLDRHGVAALAGEVLGRDIKVTRTDPNTLGPEAAPMRPMFDHHERFGLRGNALTLRAILRREPRTLRERWNEGFDISDRGQFHRGHAGRQEGPDRPRRARAHGRSRCRRICRVLAFTRPGAARPSILLLTRK